MMTMAKQPACFYGYDELGFLLNKADGTDTVSIIENNSPYVRSLKLYFNANQLGLLDPESPTQTWDDVWDKYEDGAVLFSPWPWLGQTAYNTVEHLESGKGFMMVPIHDMEILSYGTKNQGSEYVIAIGSQAQDPERMAAFIDWLYSPEGVMMSTSHSGSTTGPENLTWEMVDGRPELTEFGIQALLKGQAIMPEDWGGNVWSDGISALNFQTIIPKDINPEIGYPYDFKLWESYLEFTATPVHKSWQEQMGALTTLEYLEKKNLYVVQKATDYISPSEPARISTLRAQCKDVIVDYSWKMIFAEDQLQFDMLLSEMQKIVQQLGYEQVLAFDLESAKALNEERNKK